MELAELATFSIKLAGTFAVPAALLFVAGFVTEVWQLLVAAVGFLFAAGCAWAAWAIFMIWAT